MQFLISVADYEEAQVALNSGIDWLDLKDPSRGALGSAPLELQNQVLRLVHGCQPASEREKTVRTETHTNIPTLSVACGELTELSGPAQVVSGIQFAKLGLANLSHPGNHPWQESNWQATWRKWAAELPLGCAPVVVSYADWFQVDGISIDSAIDFASEMGVSNILVDTFQKNATGLFGFLKQSSSNSSSIPTTDRRHRLNVEETVEAKVRRALESAHRNAIRIVWAGELKLDQARQLQSWGAQVAGFRSAVCRTDRASRVCAEKIRQFCQEFDQKELVGERDAS